MTKFRIILATAVATLALAGCSKSQQELILGQWECNGQDEGMKFSGTVDYVSNGTSNTFVEMSGDDSGVTILFELMAQGTWEINETELLESIERLTITRFNIGGEEIPPESFPQEMKDAIVGVSSGSEIVQLDERVLLTKYAGSQTTCSRM